MSGEREDGGAAFPRAATQASTGDTGMTLRDWFAGQALAMLADNRMDDIGSDLVSKAIAAAAYKIADAMIKERAKETT